MQQSVVPQVGVVQTVLGSFAVVPEGQEEKLTLPQVTGMPTERWVSGGGRCKIVPPPEHDEDERGRDRERKREK